MTDLKLCKYDSVNENSQGNKIHPLFQESKDRKVWRKMKEVTRALTRIEKQKVFQKQFPGPVQAPWV